MLFLGVGIVLLLLEELMKVFVFILGLVIFGAGMAACTAAAKALHGQNPVHLASEWALDQVHEAEHNRSVANTIDRHGGDVRTMRPAPAQTPAPTVRKPVPARGMPAKTKKK